MDSFERIVRQKLKTFSPEKKVYLKRNYEYEIFQRHGVADEEVNCIFDASKVKCIGQNVAFDDCIDIEVEPRKKRRIKVIIVFDPPVLGQRQNGKVGIVTAFPL